jgi:ankyrin repeat protein
MAEQTEQVKGASFSEQILEAARFNNTELLGEVLERITAASSASQQDPQDPQDPQSAAAAIAKAINESRDALGSTALHIASHRGNYEVLDILLDQTGVEVDPHNRLDGDTPLHLAVRYATEEPEHGAFIVEELVDAGADVTALNNGGLKPVDLVSKTPESDNLLQLLQSAEFALVAEREAAKHDQLVHEEEQDEGPASESESE